MTDVAAARRARREAVVAEHMQSENVQEWDRTMATFSHARYELPDGRVVDGADAVMRYWTEGRRVVPDQRNELIRLEHVDRDHVLIEFWLRGTPTTSDRHLPLHPRLDPAPRHAAASRPEACPVPGIARPGAPLVSGAHRVRLGRAGPPSRPLARRRLAAGAVGRCLPAVRLTPVISRRPGA